MDQSRGLTAESSNSAALVKRGACLRGGQQRQQIDCATQQMKWGLELWRSVTRHDSTLLGVDVRVLIDALVRCRQDGFNSVDGLTAAGCRVTQRSSHVHVKSSCVCSCFG